MVKLVTNEIQNFSSSKNTLNFGLPKANELKNYLKYIIRNFSDI